jgi:hypothetical protein
MSENIRRFSSRRERLDHAFLAEKLKAAKSYDRTAGYFRSSIFDRRTIPARRAMLLKTSGGHGRAATD